jgi:hypothetical protein
MAVLLLLATDICALLTWSETFSTANFVSLAGGRATQLSADYPAEREVSCHEINSKGLKKWIRMITL